MKIDYLLARSAQLPTIFLSTVVLPSDTDAEGWKDQWKRAFLKIDDLYDNTNTLLHSFCYPYEFASLYFTARFLVAFKMYISTN